MKNITDSLDPSLLILYNLIEYIIYDINVLYILFISIYYILYTIHYIYIIYYLLLIIYYILYIIYKVFQNLRPRSARRDTLLKKKHFSLVKLRPISIIVFAEE